MTTPIPFGRFLLVERVAIGGMAEVFAAVERGDPTARLYALKRILPTLAEDRELVRMFLDEARLVVQLQHPGIVPVHELGKLGAGYYIAMDYVAGRDLRAISDRFRRRGERLPVEVAALVAARAADALDHAHRGRGADGGELRVVHRDVSPANVLVGFDGTVRIIDFGIAQAELRAGKAIPGRRETHDAVAEPGARGPSSGGVPGRYVEQHRDEPARRRQAACVAAGSGIDSPALGRAPGAPALRGKFGYMSPEMVRGLPVDRRSDVFALGVVLHELLAGERLFTGPSELAVMEKVRAADAAPPSRSNRTVPAELDRVVLRALARDPEARFGWASELRDALAPWALRAGDGGGRAALARLMAETFPEGLRAEEERRLRARDSLGRP